ncbi:hypothetical protein [Corallococcus caeni]|uniref:Lipoprotein n=1 Tax=Corallococcus caeni TaxID=3082388 RepID=A0ABQ6QXA1_9BACT|nr:hypothetical protein ASNO1_48960 [Corallococcus sp. NO1]
MSRGTWWIAVLVGWLAVPAAGWACSCAFPDVGLVEGLKAARAHADFIYLARIHDTDDPSEDSATLEVLESFKGAVKAGDVLRVFQDQGDCSLPLPPGSTWLLYAYDRPTGVVKCTRSRSVLLDDSEVVWLRTGNLPPVPVSLQRETVSCDACDIEEVAGRLLVAPGMPPARRSSLYSGESETRWKAGQPFFTEGGAFTDPSFVVRVGMSREGRAFELTELPQWSHLEKTCERRVQLRWCKRLEFHKGYPPGNGFRCVEPERPQEVCDERRSRKAGWLPMERLPPYACFWFRPDAPFCELSDARFPFPAGSPSLPVLACHRTGPVNGPGRYSCEVGTTPTRVPSEP